VAVEKKFAKHKNDPQDYRRAKQLRHQSSFIEQAFWHALRVAAKPHNLKFRRQHPIRPYIVDFVCLELKLVIEIDGETHATRRKQDKKREDYLRGLGYEVMRFTNEEVMHNRGGVLLTVVRRITEIFGLLAEPLP